MTAVVALAEVAPLAALKAPGNIKAAKVAIIVFFIFTTSGIRASLWFHLGQT